LSVPAEIFRAYDVRGWAQDQLTPRAAYLVGRAFARLALQRGLEKRAVVGRDVRHSSPAMLEAVKAGLMAEGFSVFDGGELITPVLYYTCHYREIPVGVMVTGSHNPPDENGLKLVLGPGTIHGEEINRPVASLPTPPADFWFWVSARRWAYVLKGAIFSLNRRVKIPCRPFSTA